MSRSPSESSFCWVPPCGTQTPPLQALVNAVTGMLVGPVNVELAGVAQSTWNFQRLSELAPMLTRKLGEPFGGGVEPSRSEGKRLSKVELSCTHCAVAGAPVSIAARSNAHTRAPIFVFPWNMLNVM